MASIGLSSSGEAALHRRGPKTANGATIAVTGWFDGIGGLRQALERMGVEIALYVSIEIDAGCRRVVRRHWPSVVEFTDVTKVETLINRFTNGYK